MPRALILSLQPPGGFGVQAGCYAKLLPHLPAEGWEFHVVGPDPRLDAVAPEPFPRQEPFCHHDRRVSRSHRCTIRKNRRRAGTPLHLWFGLRRLIHRQLEQLGGPAPQTHALEGLRAKALETAATMPFDGVAGICPDFQGLEVARHVARTLGKPFSAVYDDPCGHREKGHFHPAHPEHQRAVLAASSGAVFASPLTLAPYRRHGLLAATPALLLPDCVEVDKTPPPASRTGPPSPGKPTVAADRATAGGRAALVRGGARRTSNPSLRLPQRNSQSDHPQRRQPSGPCRREQRALPPAGRGSPCCSGADRASPQGQPALKILRLLPPASPVLVAGPAGIPLKAILDELHKGIDCDIESSSASFDALMTLQRQAGSYRDHQRHTPDPIGAYAAPRVARPSP